jgi:hypothetical protein
LAVPRRSPSPPRELRCAPSQPDVLQTLTLVPSTCQAVLPGSCCVVPQISPHRCAGLAGAPVAVALSPAHGARLTSDCSYRARHQYTPSCVWTPASSWIRPVSRDTTVWCRTAASSSSFPGVSQGTEDQGKVQPCVCQSGAACPEAPTQVRLLFCVPVCRSLLPRCLFRCLLCLMSFKCPDMSFENRSLVFFVQAASTTTSPRLPSTWSATSARSSPRPRPSPRRPRSAPSKRWLRL